MSDKLIKILLADDHHLFRQCFRDKLTQDARFAVVGEASSISELLGTNGVGFIQADILILDIQFPDGNGLDAAEHLLQYRPKLVLMVLSSFFEIELVKRALSTGIKGFFPKYASFQQIKEAMIKAARGETVICEHIAPSTRSISYKHYLGDKNDILEEDELFILQKLSFGCSCEEIAEELFISKRTLFRKYGFINEKLKVNCNIQAVAVAVKKGLINA